jgi:prepilin-type N-terminal cleavage/methylation domain-containing protein
MTSKIKERKNEGYSLVEVVVAISLMGIVVLPLIIAAQGLITSSAQNRTRAKVETVLRNAADRINRADAGCYDNLTGEPIYQQHVNAAVESLKWNASQAQVTFQWYQTKDSISEAGDWVSGICPPTGFEDDLVQMATITISSPDGKISKSAQVVKSDDV